MKPSYWTSARGVWWSSLLWLLTAVNARGQGYSPSIAASKMRPAEELQVTLVASEPLVRQPILVKFDDRGRLWTIQYLQYPNPAGLKRVAVDRWSRTVYDRVPEPPPRGPAGADRITILTDTDGDGDVDQTKDFVSGLNLATGLEFGYGGVYVLQVPYLLFYPDENRDDVPDSDPQVLLEGFGMEDAQSLANHLTWGPDGWLYGVNGSTTTCRIRGVEFQQGCWRYHPRTREFELFCEGGGNTFGVTFDACGSLFYSTNGGPFVHAVQGGYYYKSFGKHGPLHNLYAYGFFGELQRDQVPGGPPTGGTIYLADALPARWRGQFVAGNFLGHTVSSWRIQPRGSTFSASYDGVVLDVRDTWSGPTDVCLGPDGALYICDFFDRRSSHPDPDADWDRSNGRIYRLGGAASPAEFGRALSQLSSVELVDLLRHRNRWYVDRARELLVMRRDATVAPLLRQRALDEPDPRLVLQYLWALHGIGGLDTDTSLRQLDHSFQYVRAWTVRLWGDAKRLPAGVAERLIELARRDPSPVVRAQLAATAKRLPATDGLPIVWQLLDRNVDDDDPHIPLLLWWAMEAKAISARELVLRCFAHRASRENSSQRDNRLRLLRRYAAEGTRAGYESCCQLLQTSPDGFHESTLLALERGLAERSLGLAEVGQGGLFDQFATAPATDVTGNRRPPSHEPLTDPLVRWIESAWQRDRDQLPALRLALRAEVSGAGPYLLRQVDDAGLGPARRTALLGLVAEFGQADCIDTILPLLDAQYSEPLRAAAIDALARFPDSRIAERLLAEYPRLSTSLKSRVRELLLSRLESARLLLARVDEQVIPVEDVSLDQVRRVTLLGDDALNQTVRRRWGNIQPGTSEEKLAEMRRFQNVLLGNRSLTQAGDRRHGRELFAKHCGTCHRLGDVGQPVGPDLTSTHRNDLPSLLASIVDPSAVIRGTYFSYVVQTSDGLVLTGLLAEQDAASVTILDAQNKRTRIRRDQIAVLRESPTSLMPERILEQLTPQELRDLFSFLQGTVSAP